MDRVWRGRLAAHADLESRREPFTAYGPAGSLVGPASNLVARSSATGLRRELPMWTHYDLDERLVGAPTGFVEYLAAFHGVWTSPLGQWAEAAVWPEG